MRGVLAGALLLVACERQETSTPDRPGAPENVSPKLVQAIAAAEKVVLWEGLPHQTWESDLRAGEKSAKPNVERHGAAFYQKTFDWKWGDEAKTTNLFGDAQTFSQWRGYKACGGFHPDYAVEWRRGAESWEVQVCFGCEELAVYGPGLEQTFDFGPRAKHELETLLRSYRQSRPASSANP